METKLDRVTHRAAKDLKCVFSNLGHVLDENLLRRQYQRLNGRKAIGIDGITKQQYAENLEENVREVIRRIRRGTYRPQAARLVEIPKEDGSKRPLAISCFEDKMVQSAVSAILQAIYEPTFLSCSYGFRPGLNSHDALRALMKLNYQCKDGAIVEIDIQKYFNSIPQDALMKVLKKKISDARFLKLLKTLMQTPTLRNGKVEPNRVGCPQGSILSPILANIYLHHVIDEWFNTTVRRHIRGQADLVRYADDMVFVFEQASQAERFFKVLGKRFERYGLRLHLKKSQLIRAGREAAKRSLEQGKRLKTYQFLGFTCYWGHSPKGFQRLKYKSRRDRFTEKLKGLKQFLREHLNAPSKQAVIEQVGRVVRGWVNYHAISDNQRRVYSFVNACKRLLFRWFNRRGRKRPISWKRFTEILSYARFPEKWKTTSMFEAKMRHADGQPIPQDRREPDAVVPHVRF